MAPQPIRTVERLRTVVVGVCIVLLCASCRVDVDVSVTVAKDGSGVIEITAEADQAVVQQAPDLATELRFDDAIAAGWTVGVPTSTASGGLQILLTHTFQDPAQATALLATLNGVDGPLRGISIVRNHTKSLTTLQMDGELGIAGDIAAFADADLLSAIGASPFADEITRRQLQPADVMSVTFHAKLAGVVKSTTGNTADQQLTWLVPLSGPAVPVTTLTEAKEANNSWAGPLAKAALGLFIAWLVVATLFICYVALARHRRALARSGRTMSRGR